ncbi:hypothetical protein [Demequina globuliformis]|uniref:hypothetical protein n=1 Tax=Demequina globuliformis TaxID=676202 RepID=UPI0007825FEC|nr:hypothetical protein [Demequina globuliformis]
MRTWVVTVVALAGFALAGCESPDRDPGEQADQAAAVSEPSVSPAVRSSFAGEALTEDSDGDGLPDAQEADVGTDPHLADTDGDGLEDLFEIVESVTDPLLPQTYDGVPDAQSDVDGDGLSLMDERERGTDWMKTDTDADGVSDGDEVSDGTDPLDAQSVMAAPAADVVLYDGGTAQPTVTVLDTTATDRDIDGGIAEGSYAWAGVPAAIGPTLSAYTRVDPVTVELRFPVSMVDGRTADLLVVGVSDFTADGGNEYLDLELDAASDAFVARHEVKPDEQPQFQLLDREVFAAAFE